MICVELYMFRVSKVVFGVFGLVVQVSGLVGVWTCIWVSGLLFACLDLCFKCLDLYLGVWTCMLNVWACVLASALVLRGPGFLV